MFCARCGNQLVAGASFCSNCGAPTSGGAYTQSAWAVQPGALDASLKLQRPRNNRMIAGVCAGLAQHYRWDLTWVRVLTVLISLFSSGAGLVAYIVFWLVMPEEQWLLPTTVTSVPPPPAPPATGSQAGGSVAGQATGL